MDALVSHLKYGEPVVNEAMACSLPVIVSRTAGCAEDLLPEATASRSMEHGAWSRETGLME